MDGEELAAIVRETLCLAYLAGYDHAEQGKRRGGLYLCAWCEDDDKASYADRRQHHFRAIEAIKQGQVPSH